MHIITNNKMVEQKYGGVWLVVYKEIPARELLDYARDKIHTGYSLLTHPLSGSVKPHENPYKTFAMTDEPEKKADGTWQLDMDSLQIIENTIVTFDKFKDRQKAYPEHVLDDFRLIDLSLFDSSVK